MPQFVILRHTLPADSPRPSHFDLMLEHNGQLLTWSLAELPSSTPQIAEELPPHRIDYLTYEGPVANNRGEVQRVVAGALDWLLHSADKIHLRARSSQLTGEIRLSRNQAGNWSIHLLAEA